MDLAVLMTVRNNAITLKAAVESILNQSWQRFEFWIVNDASTDESATLLASYSRKDNRIKLITNRYHLGLTRSLNQALAKITTPFIARMDADDIALPKRLERQLKFLQTHPQIGLLGTAVNLIDSQDRQLGLKRLPLDHATIRRVALRYCPFIHPTWMLRRLVLFEVGEYNPDFVYAQDYELVLRIIARFKTANLAEPLLNYRVNSPEAISLKHLKQQELLALKARWLALNCYGYSITEGYKLIKPALSFLLPVGIKKIVYQRFYWH